MPTLHIEFNENGGTLFEVRYKPVSGSVWSDTTVAASPADIPIPTEEPYEYCIKKICSPGNESIEICGTAEYIPPCPTPEFSFVEKIGNNFTFDYSLTGAQPKFDLEVTLPGSGGTVITRYVTDDNPSPITITVPNLITGLYTFRMRGVCGVDINSAVSNWTEAIPVSVTVSDCAAPSLIILTETLVGGGGFIPEDFAAIFWNDTTTIENRTGSDLSVIIATDGATNYDIIENSQVWQIFDENIGDWADIATFTTLTNEYSGYGLGIVHFRLRALDSMFNTVYSNTLQYTNEGTVVLSQRSVGVTTNSTVCAQTLSNPCNVIMQDISGSEIMIGDKVTSTSGVAFNGLGKWYLIQNSLFGGGDPIFGCQIDVNGRIYNVISCL